MVITSSWCLVLCSQDIGFEICETYLKAKALKAVHQAPSVGSWSLGSWLIVIGDTYLKDPGPSAVDPAPSMILDSLVLGSMVRHSQPMVKDRWHLSLTNDSERRLSDVRTEEPSVSSSILISAHTGATDIKKNIVQLF